MRLLLLTTMFLALFSPPAIVDGAGGTGPGIVFVYVPSGQSVSTPAPTPVPPQEPVTVAPTPVPTQAPTQPTPQPTPAPARPSGTVVAVIDSGVDAGHPDFAGTLVGGWGYTYGYDGPDYNDTKGHGTKVAGVLALYSNVKIMPLRCVMFENQASDLAWCIRYAVDLDVDYILMAVYAKPTDELHAAVRYAAANGVPIVAAAGNHFTKSESDLYPTNEPGGCYYPAAYPETIAVGATDRNGNPTWWSAKGSCVDVWAVGEDIYTLSPRYPHFGTQYGYAVANGTSEAAPLWIAIREGGGLNYRRGE